MDIKDVKATLGISALVVVPSKKQDGTATDWMRSWDNDKRVQVSVHNDVVAKIKAGCNTLGIKTETKTSATSQTEYTSHIIVAYNDTEGQVVL